MMRSLLVKLGLVALAAVLAVWIGWPSDSEKAGSPVTRIGSADDATTSAQPVASPVAVVAPLPGMDQGRAGTIRPAAAVVRASDDKLDLNHATAREFERLPGIGPVLAKTLVEDRERRGPFKTVEELKRVKGIGAKRMERVRPLVMVQSRESPRRKPQ